MPTVYTEVEVDVDLEDFDTDDLVEELQRRGLGPDVDDSTTFNIIRDIYQRRRLGQDYQKELDDLIYQVVGRII